MRLPEERTPNMKQKSKLPPRPTDLELSILKVLWQDGPGSVREILRRYNEGRQAEAGYTTVLKMLQIMTEKGLVERDDSDRPQIYTAKLSEAETQRQLVSELMDKAFGGSARQLVMQALATKRASREELDEIEQLLDRLEGTDK
jgi:BlaI family transcriptional regulator, penicillinase repressor